MVAGIIGSFFIVQNFYTNLYFHHGGNLWLFFEHLRVYRRENLDNILQDFNDSLTFHFLITDNWIVFPLPVSQNTYQLLVLFGLIKEQNEEAEFLKLWAYIHFFLANQVNTHFWDDLIFP